jgi:hypothetical protein
MSVDRTEVGKPEFFEQGARSDHALDVFFGTPGQLPGAGNALEDILTARTQAGVNLA